MRRSVTQNGYSVYTNVRSGCHLIVSLAEANYGGTELAHRYLRLLGLGSHLETSISAPRHLTSPFLDRLHTTTIDKERDYLLRASAHIFVNTRASRKFGAQRRQYFRIRSRPRQDVALR